MKSILGAAAVLAFAAFGCASGHGTSDDDESNGALTSHEASFVDFTFKGEVVAPSNVVARQAIVSQLFYTEGGLTHLGGNTRPGFVRVKDVTSAPAGDGFQRIKYAAELPVLWPAHRDPPTSYKIVVPLKVDQASLDAFNAKYDGQCGKNEYGQETFWHDFEPTAEGCALGDDTFQASAEVTPSVGVIVDKYPEYDRIYADGVIKMVSVVGLDGWADQPTDYGTRVFERLVSDVKTLSHGTETAGDKTDFIHRDVTIKGTVSGKKLEHRIFLISQAESHTPEFDERYAAATADADVVTYDGHSGLGKNIRAVTSVASVKPGQYQVWFLDGCNSLGYLDDNFTARRRDANGGQDTKFVDIIGNALPSMWPGGESTSFKLIRALANLAQPKNYGEILTEFPTDQVPAVVGDEDNTFTPH